MPLSDGTVPDVVTRVERRNLFGRRFVLLVVHDRTSVDAPGRQQA